MKRIVLAMVTGHGRATPLLWKTVASSTLKGNQRRYEYEAPPARDRWKRLGRDRLQLRRLREVRRPG